MMEMRPMIDRSIIHPIVEIIGVKSNAEIFFFLNKKIKIGSFPRIVTRKSIDESIFHRDVDSSYTCIRVFNLTSSSCFWNYIILQ